MSATPQTLLEAVLRSLAHAGRYNPGDVVAPAAVLWADADGQWAALVEKMRPTCPDLFTLGAYKPEARTGPAIWLRCMIEPEVRAQYFPELTWSPLSPPIIYMPGVSRQTLRAVEECPDALKPLVELQFRGTVWTQKNGKDWTVRAFLVNDEDGLGLDVAEDKRTLQALQGSLGRLAEMEVAPLRDRRLEAEDFDTLMIGDPPRDVLRWLESPEGVQATWDKPTWAAFCNRCRREYGFDPESDGVIVGGEKLGTSQGAWKRVWERFVEAPGLYPGIPTLLRRAKPKSELTFDLAQWPDENEALENQLRAALKDIGSRQPAEARSAIEELETQHGPRRRWVWAKVNMSPLAQALQPLTELAKHTVKPLGGGQPDDMARLYTQRGYLVDDAVLQALAFVKSPPDVAAVQAAIRTLYLPWLEDTARHFQACVAAKALPALAQQPALEHSTGDCVVFVDGLRFDIGKRLINMAAACRLGAGVAWRWAALPTVTATAKPAVSPIAGNFGGQTLGPDFSAMVKANGEPLNAARFRRLLAEEGWQVLRTEETGNPQVSAARGWTECGEFDKLGHELPERLPMHIAGQLEMLLQRIEALLEAGWKRVRVVTDHGWLLVPGGMPKVQLPKYLAESRWSRCAVIKDSSQLDMPVAGWFWNPQERFAHAPGVHCFVANQQYAHGGVSLQECVVPDLTFAAPPLAADAVVTVREIKWAGLRCRVDVQPPVAGLRADLRTRPNLPSSSITESRSLDAQGKAALLVENDALEGTVASVVIVDPSGRVLCKEMTTVGGDK